MSVTEAFRAARMGRGEALEGMIRRERWDPTRATEIRVRLCAPARRGGERQSRVCRRLLALGADTSAVDARGRTALDLALRYNHSALADYLRLKGARYGGDEGRPRRPGFESRRGRVEGTNVASDGRWRGASPRRSTSRHGGRRDERRTRGEASGRRRGEKVRRRRRRRDEVKNGAAVRRTWTTPRVMGPIPPRAMRDRCSVRNDESARRFPRRFPRRVDISGGGRERGSVTSLGLKIPLRALHASSETATRRLVVRTSSSGVCTRP